MKKHILTLVAAFGLAFSATAQVIPTPQAPEQSHAQIAAEKIKSGINRGLKERISQLVVSWETLWQNPDATAQEIFAELGTNGVLVLQSGGQAVADLTAIGNLIGKTPEELLGDAKYLTPALPVHPHPDGSVTVSD